MTVSASRTASLLDTAESVVLRDINDGAETSTATEPGIRLPLINAPYWAAADAVPGDVFEITFQVDDVDPDGGTVVLSAVVDDAADMSDGAAVVAHVPVSTIGIYRVGFDRRTLADLDADISSGSKYISVRATLSGGSGGERVSYGATMTRKL